jgi:hypothetical protein
VARIFDVKSGQDVEIPFSAIDLNSALVSGEAANITLELYDEDGVAAETPTVTEKDAIGVYEYHFTPTKSRDTGYTYFARASLPVPATDGAVLEFVVRSYPTIAVSAVTGSFLTTLANVKEIDSSIGSAHDATITALIARISRMVEQRLDGNIVQATYQEVMDGSGNVVMHVTEKPITVLTAVYVSTDQLWDATTLVASGDLLFDPKRPRVYRKDGGTFPVGFQNVRIDYTAGFSSIPLEVEDYVIRKILEAFRKRQTLGITSLTLKDGSITRAASVKSMFNDIGQELPQYMRRRAA